MGAVGGGGVLFSPGAAAREGTGEIEYAVDLAELPGAVVRTERGRATDDGTCVFADGGEGTASEAGTATGAGEGAYDPGACVRRVARAVYPADGVPASVAERFGIAPARSSDAGSAGEPGPWVGSLRVNVTDPLGLDVSSTTSALEWEARDGGGVRSEHDSDWDWLALTGWTRTGAEHEERNDGTVASTDTEGDFLNSVFCLTIDTVTHHRQTYFEGAVDGSWRWAYEVEKAGGCADLLRYTYVVITP
ncbi:hypothetical protein [Streptomyces specialis]|uniref:hypothetical protein n=1 Tax=Streptomyces specialis TaxID=498367 RepID=UPI00073F33F8|nr:hypothetical protein [Streptomyces specialis]